WHQLNRYRQVRHERFDGGAERDNFLSTAEESALAFDVCSDLDLSVSRSYVLGCELSNTTRAPGDIGEAPKSLAVRASPPQGGEAEADRSLDRHGTVCRGGGMLRER